MTELVHREASLDDIGEIWSLLRETAADIPVALESDACQERALSRLMECCVSGRSGVVMNSDKKIVGALLAQRDLLDWAFANKETIDICAVAVAGDHRDSNAFKILFDALTSRGAPVYAAVGAKDGQSLADRLKDAGFAVLPGEATRVLYRWEPAAITQAA